MVAKSAKADRASDFPDDTRVIILEKMTELLRDLESFYQNLIDDPRIVSQPRKIAELQERIGISPERCIGRYSVKLE